VKKREVLFPESYLQLIADDLIEDYNGSSPEQYTEAIQDFILTVNTNAGFVLSGGKIYNAAIVDLHPTTA